MLLLLVAMLAMSLLAGCTQMTRHSNMMIFGTNTVVGLRAGTTSTSVPEVALGYARQEAVVLPLVANVVTPGNNPAAARDRLEPCDLTARLAPDPALRDGQRAYRNHPCSLVSLRDAAQDSYSVLASFGGSFSTTSQSGSVAAKGGIAQYFSTGMAAQTLALNGGAAAVASGPAAEKAAEKPSMTLTGVVAYQSDPSQRKLMKYLAADTALERKRRLDLVTEIATKLQLATDQIDVIAFLASGSAADRQKLLAGTLAAEPDPAAAAALQP